MPLYRVNARETITTERITQYEIEADDSERAAIFVSMGIYRKKIEDWEEIGVVKSERVFADPSTFAVIPAGPLIEMEEANRKHWKEVAEKNRKNREQMKGVYFPEDFTYENTGGQIQPRNRKRFRRRGR